MERFRAILASEFSRDLPAGVHPVEAWCAEPQFFPGASGMPVESRWSDVQPGSRGHPDELPSHLGRDVMVVGNFQSTLRSYRNILQGVTGGFPVTWRALRRLLASVEPSRTFLTNAHPGLPDLDSDTAPFPSTSSYLARCHDLLTTEIGLLRPILVVALGAPAARMLATITPDLDAWRPWPGFQALQEQQVRCVRACSVAGVVFTAIALHHPSAVRSNAERDDDANLISTAISATLG